MLSVLLGRGGMVGPGSALRSVHPSLPVSPMILVVTSVLTSLDATPPLDLSDPMIRLRPPPRSPLPGSGPGCNETVWFPSADPAKTWRFPCHWPRCAGRRLSNRRCCSARDSASNQGNVLQPSGFPTGSRIPETGIAPWLSLRI